MNFTDLTLLVHLFEIIALITAIKYYGKYKNTTEKWFVFFLAYTVLTETVGVYVAYFLKEYDLTIYHIFIVVSFMFYFYWFQSILKSQNQQKIITALSILFFVYAVYNLSVLSWDNYHTKTFIVGAVINIIASIFFFSQLLNDKEEIEVQKNLKFWISTGLILFNVGMVPFMLFSQEFNANNETRTVIIVLLNFILYFCYSIGFILCKKPTEN